VAARHNVPDPRTAPESLEEACEQYRIELRRFFELRVRRRDAAEDLVQLVYLRLLCRRPATLIRDPKHFMYRVAWNVLRTENQRLQREQQRTVSCSADQLENLTDRASGLWVQDDSGEELAHDQVERVLRQLPRASQFALLRQYRDGRSYKEIAEELGVTTHTVKKYIVRGLAAFRLSFNASDPDR